MYGKSCRSESGKTLAVRLCVGPELITVPTVHKECGDTDESRDQHKQGSG